MNAIDPFLKNHIDRGHAPSVQYAFFDDANVHHQFHYGLRDAGQELTAGPETSYHLFSITKTVTALAILQLAEQGRLRLDDPVSNYLSDFPYVASVTIFVLPIL